MNERIAVGSMIALGLAALATGALHLVKWTNYQIKAR